MSTCAILIAASVVPMAPPTPTEVVQRIQSTYRRAGDIEAAFTQTHFKKLRGKSHSESGHLWAKKDGRVRWEYREPNRKYFVYDGETAFFYEPDNAQVTEFERFEDSEVSNALRFLLGRGELTRTFEIRACSEGCDRGTADDLVVELWPKQPIPTVDHVLFIVDTKSWRVKTSIVVDPLKNRTEYAFTEIRFNASIDPRVFKVKIPDGVSRLRATWDGKKPE